MRWRQIDGRPLRNVGGHGDVAKRVYGEDGELWPRLTISIHVPYPGPDFKVSCSARDGAGKWWYERAIPSELRDDLIEMLRDF